MAGPNGNNSYSRAGLLALGAGACGLLVWLGVRGSTWLKGELAYHRWRQQRFHEIILHAHDALPAQPLAPGRALVWDGSTDQAAP
jgi:hypothetical protein